LEPRPANSGRNQAPSAEPPGKVTTFRPRSPLPSPPMGIAYAIANQKGGVGKTTTAVNLAAGVADAGYETLLVDLDAQCNATVGLGVGKDKRPNVYDALAGDSPLQDAVIPTAVPGLWLAPASPDLAGASVGLPRGPGSQPRLRDATEGFRERCILLFLVRQYVT